MSSIPSPSDQWNIINNYIKSWVILEEGENAYILSIDWYNSWKNYVHPDNENITESCLPSSIDNNNIIYTNNTNEYSHNYILLKPKLEENQDFIILPENAWKSLIKWYGGGPCIKRKVISDGNEETKTCRVEIYFLPIKISISTHTGDIDTNKLIIIYESKQTICKDLQSYACSHLKINPKEVRMWNTFTTPYEPLYNQLSKTLNELEIVADQTILLEIKFNGEYKIKTNSSSSSSSNITKKTIKNMKSFYSSVVSFLSGGIDTVDRVTTAYSVPSISGQSSNSFPGLCGLRNLGNTCFMNAALQCLSNTQVLTEYFLSNEYKKHINIHNPLGMKGNLAEQYAITIKHMWSGSYANVAPRNLKSVIGRFAPRFSGYAQQDSQELLGFLLDGLHEDLNTVLDKPYFEVPDEDGTRSDTIVAKEAWDRHLKRNQSIIVDKFQAQLKSTVVCPACSYVSVIFDPYMYLSLPLPSKNLYEATIIDASHAKSPIKYGARLFPGATVLDFLQEISKESGILASNMFTVTIRGRRIYSTPRRVSLISELPRMDDGSSITSVNIYEIPPEYHSFQRIHILHRKLATSRFGKAYKDLIGNPLVMFIPKDLTSLQLYFLLWKRIQRLVRPTDQDKRFIQNAKSFEEYMKEDPVVFWDWIREESSKDFNPDNLPVTLYRSTAFGSGCSCKGKCSCKIIPDDTVLLFNSKQNTIAIEWNNIEVYSTENGNTLIPSPSLLQIRIQHKNQKSIKLEDCLELFSEKETLGENDKWYCPKCKEFVCADKKMDLWSSPEVLIIHLKRFSQRTRRKITSPVSYPLTNLDLDPYLLNPDCKGSKYDLFGVSCHSGSLSGGHYTAVAKNFKNGNWYGFNDSSVSQVKQISGCSSSAYLLFYCKRNEILIKSSDKLEEWEEIDD